MHRPSLTLLSAFLFLGCSTLAPQEPLEVSHEALPSFMRSAQGVSIDDSGRVLILSENQLFERVSEGEWNSTPVWTAAAGTLPLFDVVSLGEGRFALTALNMGYELDLASGELTEHFCYLPGDDVREEPVPNQGEPTSEQSHCVAYDEESGLILANPQTMTTSGVPVFSEVASFDRATGDELVFRSIDEPDFAARGLAVLDFPILLAASGGELSRVNFDTGVRESHTHIEGAEAIEGISIDHRNGRVVFVDGGTMRLGWLQLSAVQSEPVGLR